MIPSTRLRYASARAGAAAIDSLTAFFVHACCLSVGHIAWWAMPGAWRDRLDGTAAMMLLASWILISLVAPLLFIALQISRGGLTTGKRLCGLKIATTSDAPITFRRAVARSLALVGVSMIGTAGIGLVVAVFRHDRRCLHDLICATEVVPAPRRPSLAAEAATGANPAPGSRLRRALVPAALVLLSTGLCVFGFEIGYRLYLAMANPWVTLTPGGVCVRSGGHGKHAGASVNIDDRGCRFVPAAGNSDLQRRVLVMGDSVAFGLGVSDGEVFTHLLNEKFAADDVSYVNLGRPGWDTGALRDLLYQRGAEFAPDEILWMYFVNDATTSNRYWPPTRAGRPETGLRRLEWSVYRVLRWPFLLKPLAQQTLAALHLRPDGPKGGDWEAHYDWCMASYAEDSATRTNEGRFLQDIIEWTRKHDCQLRVVVAPAEDQLANGDTLPQDFVRSFCSEQLIPVLDLLPVLREAQTDTPLYLAGDAAHWNPQGHRFVSDALEQWMRQ